MPETMPLPDRLECGTSMTVDGMALVRLHYQGRYVVSRTDPPATLYRDGQWRRLASSADLERCSYGTVDEALAYLRAAQAVGESPGLSGSSTLAPHG